jgi:hypothetical protein
MRHRWLGIVLLVGGMALPSCAQQAPPGNTQGAPSAGNEQASPSRLPALSLTLPDRSVKPDAQARQILAAAKTVALVIVGEPATTKEISGRTIRITEHGGIRRKVDAEKARREVEKVLKEWGRLTLEEDPVKADLVLAVAETSVPPSGFSRAFANQTQYRLRTTLAVFRGGPELGSKDKALWANTASENAFSALASTPTTSLTKRFRSDVEAYAKTAKE